MGCPTYRAGPPPYEQVLSPAEKGSSAEGASTLGGSEGMLPREILKFSFSTMHILRILRET